MTARGILSKNNISNNDDALMMVIIMHVVVLIKISIARRTITILKKSRIIAILKSYTQAPPREYNKL